MQDSPKMNNPLKKWAKNIDIFPKKAHRWQQTHEKVLNITPHQGNTNQNYNEVSLHTFQNS